jgi:hypothetical protein
MEAGQEPAEDASQAPTPTFPAVADDELIEMPRSSMPDHSFLQDALAVADPAGEQRVEERTWKIAIGAVVLVAVSIIVIVVFVGYVTQMGPPVQPVGAKPTFPEAAGSSRVTAAPPSAQPVAPGASAVGRDADPSRTASAAPTTSPPGETTSPAGSALRASSSAGGTIVAGCSGSDAYLASWQAAVNYRVKSVTPGPDVQAAVTFKAQGTEITMTVTCPGGVPVVSTSAKFS